MAQAHLMYPPTLAFTFCTTLPYDKEFKEISIVSLDTKFDVENLLLEEIKKFVDSTTMQKYEQVEYCYTWDIILNS